MVDVSKALHPNQARKMLNSILDSGTVRFTSHAEKEMAADGISASDVADVLRGGRIEAPEFEKGSWRYRTHLADTCVVFAFRAEDNAVVVTAWRKS